MATPRETNPIANPMAVTLSQFKQAQADFQAHYFLADCGTNFGGQSITLSWSALQTEVTAYMNATGARADEVALRFVICFDGQNLYLRMEICSMVYQSPNNYSLDSSQSSWFAINANGLNPTNDTDLFNVTYLSDFYYCDAVQCSAASLEQLSSDTAELKYVRNIVMPWGLEILLMYNANPTAAYITFNAASFYKGGASGSPGVDWPHVLVLYLENENNEVLMDDKGYTDSFAMKGCDMGSLCPATCNACIIPV
ncbi:MAG: hypothetical protein V4649_12425 [Bacteroidota bacterium]